MSKHISQKIRDIEEHLNEWVKDTEAASQELCDLADDLDGHFQRINKAKIGGAAGAVVGGVMTGIGFGLSFFTAGASLALAAAGGVIAGAGGATVAGAAITDAVLAGNRRKKAEEAFSAYNEKLKVICEECYEIGVTLEGLGNIDEKFSSWVRFWAKLIKHSGKAVKCVGWKMIGSTLLKAIRYGKAADDVAKAGIQSGATAFRTIGTTTGRALHVAGGFVGVVLLPLDVYTLVSSAIDVHKENPHEVSKSLRKIADELKEKCPSKSEIDTMVNETLKGIKQPTHCV